MATFTDYAGNGGDIAAKSGGNYAGAPAASVLTAEFDAAKLNVVAADVIEVMNIPAGTLVKDVIMEVITPEAAQTVDIGDATDPNGYVAAGSGAAAGLVLGAGALVSAGKLYTAADTIDITVPAGGAYNVLKVRIVAHVVLAG